MEGKMLVLASSESMNSFSQEKPSGKKLDVFIKRLKCRGMKLFLKNTLAVPLSFFNRKRRHAKMKVAMKMTWKRQVNILWSTLYFFLCKIRYIRGLVSNIYKYILLREILWNVRKHANYNVRTWLHQIKDMMKYTFCKLRVKLECLNYNEGFSLHIEDSHFHMLEHIPEIKKSMNKYTIHWLYYTGATK